MIEVFSRKTFADPLQPGQACSGAAIFEDLVSTLLEYVNHCSVLTNMALMDSDM